MQDLTNMIVDYEQGQLSEVDSIKLFAHLIKTRLAWKLQGSYGRMAHNLIDSGIINFKGTVLVDLESFYE